MGVGMGLQTKRLSSHDEERGDVDGGIDANTTTLNTHSEATSFRSLGMGGVESDDNERVYDEERERQGQGRGGGGGGDAIAQEFSNMGGLPGL